MRAVVVMLPTGEMFISVPDQPAVTFEEAAAAIRKLRAKLELSGVSLAGENLVESHLPDAQHEAIHQAEREARHA